MRGEDAAGNAQPQHEGVLRGGNIEKSVKLEPEQVVRRRRFVLRGMGEQLVPDVESILLMLPYLFAAKIRNRRAEVEFLALRSFIGNSRGRVGRDQASSRLPDKRSRPMLGHARKKSSQVFLLCGRKRLVGNLVRNHQQLPRKGTRRTRDATRKALNHLLGKEVDMASEQPHAHVRQIEHCISAADSRLSVERSVMKLDRTYHNAMVWEVCCLNNIVSSCRLQVQAVALCNYMGYKCSAGADAV